ncbi:MAG TPA: hypothetical protein VK021_06480 [Flavobacteriaceae bacterium]|nr:hypothetical protein [Flavobacteriaceae bacterium]
MKTIKHFALFLFLACFVACSSDDDNKSDSGKSGSGSFSYKGKTYDLKSGIIENDGNYWSDDNSTEYYITLITSGLLLDQIGEPIPSENKFSLIDFNLFSQNADKPKPGVYNFNDDDYINFTFEEAEAVINMVYNPEEDETIGDFEEFVYANSGKIELHQSGNTYEMDFEFTMNNGEKLTGHYKGELLVYEYDDFDDWRPANKSFFQSLKTFITELKS